VFQERLSSLASKSRRHPILQTSWTAKIRHSWRLPLACSQLRCPPRIAGLWHGPLAVRDGVADGPVVVAPAAGIETWRGLGFDGALRRCPERVASTGAISPA
jgi:hypothetical protein